MAEENKVKVTPEEAKDTVTFSFQSIDLQDFSFKVLKGYNNEFIQRHAALIELLEEGTKVTNEDNNYVIEGTFEAEAIIYDEDFFKPSYEITLEGTIDNHKVTQTFDAVINSVDPETNTIIFDVIKAKKPVFEKIKETEE